MSRPPGTLCVTSVGYHWVDDGTTCLTRSSSPGNIIDSVPHDIFFEVTDSTNRKPMAFTSYRIILSNFREITGVTDAFGRTFKVYADAPLLAKLEIPYYGNNRNTPDTGSEPDTCFR